MFAVHGDSASSRLPWARMFVGDGRSLSQCLVQPMMAAADDEAGSGRKKGKHLPYVWRGARVKRKWEDDNDDDYVCSVCHDCGELLMCDRCPSMFHHACVGLDSTPQGDWFCPASTDLDDPPPTTTTTRGLGGFSSDKMVISCEQCRREYHVGCVRENGLCYPEADVEVPWLCSEACSKIYLRLEELAVVQAHLNNRFVMAACHWRLRRGGTGRGARQAVHGLGCAPRVFSSPSSTRARTPTSPRTSSSTLESELRRLDFRGFYVVGLEKAGELITVATLRMDGEKVAEVPLVGTRFAHRRQGMCRLLMDELQKLLGETGVERLVLPAVPDLVATWTGSSFGFREMGQELAHHAILCFQGTTYFLNLNFGHKTTTTTGRIPIPMPS